MKKQKVAVLRMRKVRLKMRGDSVCMRHKLTLALCALFLILTSSCLGSREAGTPVSFRTADGFLLEGRTFGSGTKGIVLSHMFGSDQSSWFDFAERVATDGYLVLTYNFRGYEGSQGSKDVHLMSRDTEAAVAFLKEKKSASSVAIVGASMGGTASVIASSMSDVEALATLSAPVEFRGLDSAEAVTRVAAAKLFLASVGDAEAAGDAERLLRLSRDPGAEIKLFPGDAHGTDMLRGRRSAEVAEALHSFLSRTT